MNLSTKARLKEIATVLLGVTDNIRVETREQMRENSRQNPASKGPDEMRLVQSSKKPVCVYSQVRLGQR